MLKQDFMPTAGATARVRAAVAPMLGTNRIASVLTSQALAGQLVQVLDGEADWWRVRSADAYEGWMHRGYLEAATGNESDWPITTGAVVREADGRVRALPFGARVAPDAMLLSGEAFDDDERARLHPPESARLVATAETFFVGASYQWGGVTPWGCDCSGVVQAVAAFHDVRLPRDAWQQALEGELVHAAPLDIDALQPFDLLFFSDREDQRITHVGITLENGRMLHSALARGGVYTESLRSDDPYVLRLRAQFVTARRVLHASHKPVGAV